MSPVPVPVYEPKPVIQGDGHPLQWKNCTCAGGATSLERDTEGRYRTTAGRVRDLTRDENGLPDRTGGNTLLQIDDALKRGWPPQDHMDERRRMAFEDAVYEVANGRGANIQGSYDWGFSGSIYDGSPGFTGNHDWYWNEVRIVFFSNGRIDYDRSLAKIWDPLWDGRRRGIPGYNSADPDKPFLRFRWIKLSLLRRLAGGLRMNSGNRLGIGYCYIGFTRITSPPEAEPTPQPSPIKFGANRMIVAGGLVLTSSHVVSVRKEQPFYREAKTGSDIVARASADYLASAGRGLDYFGYGAPGWYSVLIVTGNFPDGVKRPTIVYCPRAAGPVTKKV